MWDVVVFLYEKKNQSVKEKLINNAFNGDTVGVRQNWQVFNLAQVCENVTFNRKLYLVTFS